MDLNLKNKVILITGGSSGIGRGIALTLAQEGANLFIVGRNETNLKLVIKELKQFGVKAAYCKAELTQPEDCKKAVDECLAAFGTLDGLVNNAGVNDSVGLEKGNHEDFMRSISRNLTHYYMMAHYALPQLKITKGTIVNIGSKTSVTGQGGTSGYAAANGGRNALTREWAVELLPHSIRVNAVIVAECYTPLYERWISSLPNSKERLEEINNKIPLENRMTTEFEIGNTVAFLLSDKSSHTTGQLLFVDGGYTHLDRAL